MDTQLPTQLYTHSEMFQGTPRHILTDTHCLTDNTPTSARPADGADASRQAAIFTDMVWSDSHTQHREAQTHRPQSDSHKNTGTDTLTEPVSTCTRTCQPQRSIAPAGVAGMATGLRRAGPRRGTREESRAGERVSTQVCTLCAGVDACASELVRL